VEHSAVDPRDLDLAAGRRVGAGDAPHRVVDADGADAVDDRFFQREHAPDIRSGAAVEKRLVGRRMDRGRAQFIVHPTRARSASSTGRSGSNYSTLGHLDSYCETLEMYRSGVRLT
jgi:hypothetical protein